MKNLNLDTATRKELLDELKELGIKGVSRKSRQELVDIFKDNLQTTLPVEEKQETAIIHISKKQLILWKIAQKQKELESVDNGVIITPATVTVEEKEINETVKQTLTRLYEKHYTNDSNSNSGRKKGGNLYVAPAQELQPIKEGSKVHRFIQKMIYGATIEDLCEITPNPKSVKVYFSYDLKLKGYGTKQDGDKYYIIFPDGVYEPLLKAKLTAVK